MNRKVALVVLGVLGVAFTLAVIGLVVFLFTRPAQPASDEEVIRQLFQTYMLERKEKLGPNQEFEILDLKVDESNEWAIVEFSYKDTESEEVVPMGPGLVIMRKVENEWRLPTPGSNEKQAWLEEIPTSLVPEAAKELLR